MSKVAEAYLNKDYEVEEPKRVSKRKPPINMSEKNKCLYYGISCSYGICDECEIHNERSRIQKCIQEIGIGISIISVDKLAGPAELIAKRGQ